MKKVAILVDLELNNYAGGHVKFWERISYAIKDLNKEFRLTIFFLGKKFEKKKISKNIIYVTLKPFLSSKILRPLGVDADSTDLFPVNFKLFFILRNFDIIHSTDQLFSMARTAKYASRFWKIPLTTSLHTDTPSYSGYYIKKIFKKFPKFLGIIFINKLKLDILITKKQRINIQKYIVHCKKAMINDELSFDQFNFPKDLKKKITRLSRGVDKNVFKKININEIKLRKEYGISKDQKVIFFCGRIHELKGVILLSKIHKILKKKIDVVSLLAGQNIHGKECLKLGGNKIKLIGYKSQRELSLLYNFCDLFVFPSKFEIGPQVVLEAKSCGTICVVSPDGGGKRIHKNGVDGLIIQKYDADEWGNQILKLLKDKKKISFMRNKILSEFQPKSWKNVYDEFFYKNWNEILG